MENTNNLTLIATILGATIAGSAMIINSIVSTWLNNRKENLHLKQKQFEKNLSEISQLYENCLLVLKKLINDYDRATDKEWENFYEIEIKLKLYSEPKIVNKFVEVKNSIVDFSHKLSKIPEEFIPKFEKDSHREERLNNRKKAKEKRIKEAQRLLPEVNKNFTEFSEMLKANLNENKKLKNL